MNCYKAKTRDLYSVLHDLHAKQSGTPKNASPETVSWLIREIRDTLAERGYSADLADVLNGGHVVSSDPESPTWHVVYPLTDIDPREDRERVESLFRLHYFSHITSPYDCSGETFTLSFHVFKRRGEWWAYEWLATDV